MIKVTTNYYFDGAIIIYIISKYLRPFQTENKYQMWQSHYIAGGKIIFNKNLSYETFLAFMMLKVIFITRLTFFSKAYTVNL